MKMILLGAPGCGKGTISKYLVDHFGFIHLSTGDILRNTINKQEANWQELKDYMSKGLLIPDELTNQIFKNELQKHNRDALFVFDGFPRTLLQAQFLASFTKIDIALNLDISLSELEKRLVGRRLCSKCNKIYNIYFAPPLKENVCDNDGTQLIQRKDDTKQVIENRLAVYQNTSIPVIDFYKNQQLFVNVDANNKDFLVSEIDKILIDKFHLKKR
ncbi:MAG: nucleoside monophosphate kinase [Malacoplasma sp.]|nr:nucleoside monophosphate kinase [Malacoplasma sp.]